jgi:hypothetical protein
MREAKHAPIVAQRAEALGFLINRKRDSGVGFWYCDSLWCWL